MAGFSAFQMAMNGPPVVSSLDRSSQHNKDSGWPQSAVAEDMNKIDGYLLNKDNKRKTSGNWNIDRRVVGEPGVV